MVKDLMNGKMQFKKNGTKEPSRLWAFKKQEEENG